MTAATINLSAGMPLDLLVDKLQRVEGLERRHVGALRALALLLPRGSAAGKATADQLARRARYSQRWMRHSLAELEEAGLIEWWRGGVQDGRPQPSVFRVSKAALCEVIRAGSLAAAARAKVRNAATKARLEAVRVRKLVSRAHNRRSAHAEVGDNLSPFGEVTPPGVEAPGRAVVPPEQVRDYAASARELLRATKRARLGLSV